MPTKGATKNIDALLLRLFKWHEHDNFPSNGLIYHETAHSLKAWYQERFQKSNRWNKTMINKETRTMSLDQMRMTMVCFEYLFDPERKYNQVFLAHFHKILEDRTEVPKQPLPKIRISQKAYLELLRIMGEWKSSREIKSTYKELSEIIYMVFTPENPIKPSTIIDRLKDQKGYK